jgi:hypothetical protein
MRRILFLAAKIQEELGSLHVLPDFLLLHAMIAPPLCQARKGGGYNNSSVDSSKNLRFLVLPHLQVGIKEPFLPGISRPRIKRSASAGYKKRGRINRTRQHQKGRPMPGISKRGQNKRDPPASKGSARAGYVKKGGRINRTRQHQKGRPVPGISKRGQNKQNPPASKESGQCRVFQNKEGQNQQNWRFRVFSNSSTNPTWFFIIDLPK